MTGESTAAGPVNLMHAMKVYKNAEEETCSTANKNNKHGNSYRGLPGNDEEPDSALPMIWLTQVLISFFKSYINNNAFKPIFTAIRMFFYDY